MFIFSCKYLLELYIYKNIYSECLTICEDNTFAKKIERDQNIYFNNKKCNIAARNNHGGLRWEYDHMWPIQGKCVFKCEQ